MPAPQRPEHVPVACDPVHHPVARAWRTIAPPRTRVDRLECLRAQKKEEVYRLTLVNDATSIIAKRASTEALLVERTLYESVLPRLPSPALRYFGFVRDEDGEASSLFIEDAGDQPCSLGEHGILVAHWLGTLHGSARELDLGRFLPERGPAHHLEHLRAARTRILDNFDNQALLAEDKHLLRALVSTCELIESSWKGVEELCNSLPRTLVHGDLAARNLRFRHNHAGPEVVAFEWECAGFGVPAADVYQLAVEATQEDLSSYRSTVSEYAESFGEDELGTLLLVGEGFRLLAAVDWITPHLRFRRPQRATSTLPHYERPLREWGERLAAAA